MKFQVAGTSRRVGCPITPLGISPVQTLRGGYPSTPLGISPVQTLKGRGVSVYPIRYFPHSKHRTCSNHQLQSPKGHIVAAAHRCET